MPPNCPLLGRSAVRTELSIERQCKFHDLKLGVCLPVLRRLRAICWNVSDVTPAIARILSVDHHPHWRSETCARACGLQAVTLAHALTLMVGCRNPQRQMVTRPKGQQFQWLSSGESSLGSKP